MTSFETTIRKRLRMQTIKAIAVFVFVAVAFAVKLYLAGGIEAMPSFDLAILVGFLMGGELSAIPAILKYRKALTSPEALEEQHINEKDDRNRIINLKACRQTVYLTLVLLGVGGVIASFFSETVLTTIGGVLIAILGIYILMSMYYSRKF